MQLHNKLLTHTSTLVFVSVAVPQLYTKTRCPVCGRYAVLSRGRYGDN